MERKDKPARAMRNGTPCWKAAFTRDGEVDRKAELDDLFTRVGADGSHEVIGSATVGDAYYAALRTTCADGSTRVTPVMARTYAYADGLFGYRPATEDRLPLGMTDCPEGILDLLSPAGSAAARAWRMLCRLRQRGKARRAV